MPPLSCMCAQCQQRDAGSAEVIVAGVRLAAQTNTLGLTFRNGDVDVGWGARMPELLRRTDRLAGLPLSMFGRGLGSAGYVVSTILYHAEFGGSPPPAMVRELQRLIAKLVVQGAAPADDQRRFAGIRAELIVGSPSSGGLGVLPFVEHMRARWAKWAARLLTDSGGAPWVRLARGILEGLEARAAREANAAGAARTAGLGGDAAAAAALPHAVGWLLEARGDSLPGPLQRLRTGLDALPRFTHAPVPRPLPPIPPPAPSPGALPPPGPWCFFFSLWDGRYKTSHLPVALTDRAPRRDAPLRPGDMPALVTATDDVAAIVATNPGMYAQHAAAMTAQAHTAVLATTRGRHQWGVGVPRTLAAAFGDGFVTSNLQTVGDLLAARDRWDAFDAACPIGGGGGGGGNSGGGGGGGRGGGGGGRGGGGGGRGGGGGGSRGGRGGSGRPASLYPPDEWWHPTRDLTQPQLDLRAVFMRDVFLPVLGGGHRERAYYGKLGRRQLHDALCWLERALPPQWLAAARAAAADVAAGRLRPGDPQAREPPWPTPAPVLPQPFRLYPSVETIRRETGWGRPGAPRPRDMLAALTVKRATQLQLGRVWTERGQLLHDFAALALGSAGSQADAAAGGAAGEAGSPAPADAAANAAAAPEAAAAGAAAAGQVTGAAAAGQAAERAAAGQAAGAAAAGQAAGAAAAGQAAGAAAAGQAAGAAAAGQAAGAAAAGQAAGAAAAGQAAGAAAAGQAAGAARAGGGAAAAGQAAGAAAAAAGQAAGAAAAGQAAGAAAAGQAAGAAAAGQAAGAAAAGQAAGAAAAGQAAGAAAAGQAAGAAAAGQAAGAAAAGQAAGAAEAGQAAAAGQAAGAAAADRRQERQRGR